MKCYNCSKLGHFARDCHSAPKARIAEGQMQDYMSNADDETLVEWSPSAPTDPVQGTAQAFRALTMEQKQAFAEEIGVGSSSRGSGFSEHLITSALIRLISSEQVYISGGRQSMNLKVFLHTRNERAETSALLDCSSN
jgi:hypothetical protein